MANIEKLKFHSLEVSGTNYLSWCLDIELHLQGQCLVKSLVVNEKVSDQDKGIVLIFICRHLHESLKIQYLEVRDLLNLWTKLREQYDHTKTVILP